jgi:putative tricarboxylic transport membrane protein
MKCVQRLVAGCLLAALSILILSLPAAGAEYPTKPIMVMAPSGAGGGWDTTARTVAAIMQQERIVPQPLQVFNREGGSGTVGLTELVTQNRGNAYLLMVTSPPIILNQLTGMCQYGYRDVVPLANLITDYMILAVKPDSRFKTLKDLAAAIRQNPHAVKLGGGGAPGSMNHLALMYVLDAAGVDVKSLPYVSFQGDGKALAAVLGGHVDVASISVGPSISYLEAKKLGAVAVTSEQRLPGAGIKEVATAKEQGADAVYPIWRGIVGPPDMPDDAVTYLQKALTTMAKTKAWQEALEKRQWIDSFDAVNFKAFLKEEYEKNTALLEKLGLLKK